MTAKGWLVRAYRASTRPCNRWLLRARDRRRLAARLAELRAAGGWPPGRPPVFVVVVPNTLGWLEPCVKLIPEEIPTLLVANGLDRAEQAALRSAFPRRSVFELSVLPSTFVRHGEVLDLLVAAADSDLILLDHDCYVFERSLFEPIDWREGELLAGIDCRGFYTMNAASGLRFPRTHFLVLRRDALLDLRERHGVGCAKKTRTPRSVASLLASVGLGDHNFPPARMPFYDTLQLAVAVGLAEGRTVRWLQVPEGGISHVGGTARLRNLPGGSPADPGSQRL